MPTKIRKLAFTITKTSGGGAGQPAAASIDIRKQGATVSAPATVNNGQADVAIGVYDIGRIKVGDKLQKGTSATPTVTVDQILNRSQVRVDSDNNGVLSLVAGDRLVVVGDKPTLYSESTGTTSKATFTTDGSTGYGEAFLRERFVDAIITGTNVATQLRANEASGYQEPPLDIRDYGNSLADALAALPATGGVIHLPAGTYEIGGTITIDKSVTLVGEGPNATVIRPSSANPSFHMFEVPWDQVRLINIGFDGRATSAGGVDIMRFNGLGVSPNHNNSHCYIENCQFTNARRNALRLTDVTLFLAVNTPFIYCWGDGCVVQTSSPSTDPPGTGSLATTTAFIGCIFSQNKGRGLNVDHCTNFMLLGCGLEGNSQDGVTGTASDDASGARIYNAIATSIVDCDFEAPGTAAVVQNLLFMDICPGSRIESCNFFQSANGVRAFTGGGVGGNNDQVFMGNTIAGGTASTVAVLSGMGCFVAGNNLEAGERIEPSGRSFSFQSGILGLPLFTTAQRPAATTVPAGSVIWVTDATPGQQLQVADGTAWKYLGLN